MADIVYGSSGDCRLDLGSPSEVEVSAQLMFMMRTRATRLVNSYIESYILIRFRLLRRGMFLNY